MIGGFVLGLVIVVWWLFFSRAPWSERLGAIVVMVLAVAATSLVVHPSIAGGHMGMTLYLYSIPNLCLALVIWAVVSRGFSPGLRRASMVAAIVIAAGTMALVRSDGARGEGESEFHWRWTPTAEERLLAQAKDEPLVAVDPNTQAAPTPPAASKSKPAAPTDPRAKAPVAGESAATRAETPVLSESRSSRVEWPGFRGPARDGIVRGVQIETDWSRTPPVELWRKPIGPAWSSFAVHGDRIFTQEQRGDDELVSAYDLKTGAPVWRHRDARSSRPGPPAQGCQC